MYVSFPVAQTELMKIREDRQQEDGTLTKIEFVIHFPDGSTYPHAGRWDFTSPQVDQQTDTVEMRATLPNPERTLIDGQYVKVILRERKPKSRLVVPQAAVQTAQGGTQVLVVDKDNKVGARIVELGQTAGSDYVVLKGLKPGERVIVDGIQKAKPGQVVQPTEVKEQPTLKEQEQGGDQGNKAPDEEKPGDKGQDDKAKGAGQ
jgi:membrane fusion protein (multidrug efflux system)